MRWVAVAVAVLLHGPSAAQIRTATVHLKQELEVLLQRPVDLVRLRERMNPALRATSMMVEQAWQTVSTEQQR